MNDLYESTALLIVTVLTLGVSVWNAYYNRDIVRAAQREQRNFEKVLALAQHDLDLKLNRFVVELEPIRTRLELQTRDLLGRQDAEIAFVDDITELQRHSLENWTVMQRVIALTVEPDETPFDFHIANFAYLQDFKSFQAENVAMLPPAWRSMAQKIRIMLRNANNEIGTALEIAKRRDARHLRRIITETLVPKAQCFFTIWTVAPDRSFHDSLSSKWQHYGPIEAARRDELFSNTTPDTAWKLETLRPGDAPLGSKPIRMFDSKDAPGK